VLRTGCKNDRFGMILIFSRADNLDLFVKNKLLHTLAGKFRAHFFSVCAQRASEIHAADARKAGIVVYFIGIQHLAAACKVCLNRKRGELCAFRINRGRKTRWAGADDDNVV